MTKDEALKLALEALECKDGWGSSSRVLKERAVTSLRTALNASKIEGDLIQRFYEGEEAKSLISEAEEAITALREALAEQPAQQQDIFECDVQARPLSYPLRDYHRAMSEGPLHYTWTDKPHRLVYDLIAAVKYYAAPQQPAQQQEPVAWMGAHDRTDLYYRKPPQADVVPLYTSPPASKPWVGLTQQDIDIAFDDTQEGGGFDDFARAIETKLREKNSA